MFVDDSCVASSEVVDSDVCWLGGKKFVFVPSPSPAVKELISTATIATATNAPTTMTIDAFLFARRSCALRSRRY